VRLLEALEAWSGLAAEAVPVRHVEVSQAGHFGRTRIDARDEGVDALGQVVSYGGLARALAERAAAAPGVEWIVPARVHAAERDPAGSAITVRAEGPDGAPVARAARLAVAADGAQSPLREALGIDTRSHDYAQVALLAQVAAGGDEHTAHERFSRDGTLALLPGGGERRTLVWSVAAERADGLADLAVDDFARAAAARLGADVYPLRCVGPVQRYPLKRVEACAQVVERAAVLGNAARTLHPVAAQGFNLALRDACALAARLADADDPGGAERLAAWDRERRRDRWLTRTFTDGLARLFGHHGAIPPALRAAALLGLDLCPPGRHALAAQTMGLAAGLPRVGNWRPEAWR